MYRAHTWRSQEIDGGCWFFSGLPPIDGPGGRFDLVKPRGTCYWATSELGAARERLGRPGDFIADDEIDGAVVSRSSFDPGGLADLTHTDAARRGVTAELSAATPYVVSQRWAVAFSDAGFDGVHYRARFSTDTSRVVALFGQAGSHERMPPVGSSRSVADVLVEAGYTVLARPRAAELGDLLE